MFSGWQRNKRNCCSRKVVARHTCCGSCGRLDLTPPAHLKLMLPVRPHRCCKHNRGIGNDGDWLIGEYEAHILCRGQQDCYWQNDFTYLSVMAAHTVNTVVVQTYTPKPGTRTLKMFVSPPMRKRTTFKTVPLVCLLLLWLRYWTTNWFPSQRIWVYYKWCHQKIHTAHCSRKDSCIPHSFIYECAWLKTLNWTL